jgi:LysW-gamma-L-alpha-aminoadipyl-6-phosphate/LysW-L-glutamyl-5-phosphate reductase
VPGCIATASILALRPLVQAGLVDAQHVVVDAKSGSSASGRDSGPAGLHAERSGVMRAYAPAGHRHTAEIEQETGVRVALSCHGVEAVRGVLATVHAFATRDVEEKELWRAYRAAYGAEPFVRIVHESDGAFREPEPKILAGTNFCDVGFAVDPHAHRVVALAALDNLGKGAAGAAVQCFNLRAGFPETAGLEFLGLHPI